MNRFLASVALGTAFFALSGSLSAADVSVTVSKITGKVEVQQGSDWVPLRVGQVLLESAWVSTGFRSELQLKIGPSIVTVKALSRLNLKGLVQNGTDLKTDLFLKVGKIDAEVNKDVNVQGNKFTVSSPVATASVRGTAFTFDGVNLEVTRGLVDFSVGHGNFVSVPVGEVAHASGSGKGIQNNQDIVAEESTTQSNAGSDYGADSWTDQDWTNYFNSVDLESLLSYLSGYDWASELPNTHIHVGGIY